MDDGEQMIVGCLQNILNGKLSDARSILSSAPDGEDGRWAGRRSAINGIISIHSRRRNRKDVKEHDGLSELKELVKSRLGSIWCDEFDRGYYEVWLKLIDLSQGKAGAVRLA